MIWPFKKSTEAVVENIPTTTKSWEIKCDICAKVIGYAAVNYYIGVFEILQDGRKFNDVLLGKKHYACLNHSRAELQAFIESK